jgi:hypothetical protein
MVLQLPHTEGGFGVTFNDVAKDAVFYTTTSHFVAWLGAFSQVRQDLWYPKDDVQDSSSWSSPPILLIRDIHSKLLTDYGCKEASAPSQSQAQRSGQKQGVGELKVYRLLKSSIPKAFYF